MKKVIILHGWTKNLDQWQRFINALKEKNVLVDFPKIPGLTENLKETWKLSDYVNWLKNIVDKEKDKVILIGHSNGGRISISFANSFPEKVEKLILIDSAGIYHNELPLALKRIIFKTLAKFGKALKGSSALKNAFYKLTGENDYNDASLNMKQTMLNLINSDKSLKFKNIQTPTLIIWGADDKITPLSDGILMNKLINNSKLEIITGAKHSPMYTHTQEVAKIVYEYL